MATDTLTPTLTEIVWVPLDLIDPNPYQPRQSMDPDKVAELADNIDAIGLLQEPLMRPHVGRYQSAFGHRRIEAVRHLAATGRWEGDMPAKLAELTDREMAYMALSENTEREDISPVEALTAWREALTIEDVTISELAEKVGIDRSTMSKNLRVLELPAEALALVHDGSMKVRAARELVCLITPTHSHDDMIRAVLHDCGSESRWSNKAPDYRVKSIRASIRGLTIGSSHRSTFGMSNTDRLWRSLKIEGTSISNPKFDVDGFKWEHPDDVHVIPEGELSGGREWTCNVKEWRRRQTAATREENKAKSAGAKPSTTGQDTYEAKRTNEKYYDAWLKGVKKDPVVQEVVGKSRTRKMKDFAADTTEEQREALGTRAKPLTAGWDMPDDVIALPVEAWPEGAAPRLDRLGGPRPPMFDFSQCATCTTGAAWLAKGSWDPALLMFVCTNMAAYNDKKAQGAQKFIAHRDVAMAEDDLADITAAGELAGKLDDGWSRLMLTVLSSWLLADQSHAVKAWPPEPNCDKYDYYPVTAEMFAELLHLELPAASGHNFGQRRDWSEGVREKLYSGYLPDHLDLPVIAAAATIWRARTIYGMGKTLPVAMATGDQEDAE